MTGNCAVPLAHQSTCVMEYHGHKTKVNSGTMVWQSPEAEEALKSFIPEIDSIRSFHCGGPSALNAVTRSIRSDLYLLLLCIRGSTFWDFISLPSCCLVCWRGRGRGGWVWRALVFQAFLSFYSPIWNPTWFPSSDGFGCHCCSKVANLFACLMKRPRTHPFNIQSCLLRKIQSNKKNLINFVNVEMLLYFLHVGKCPPWPSFKLCAMEQTKCLITLWTCYHQTSFMSMTIMCIENKQLNHELVPMDQMHME